jgi:hypothetical protein
MSQFLFMFIFLHKKRLVLFSVEIWERISNFIFLDSFASYYSLRVIFPVIYTLFDETVHRCHHQTPNILFNMPLCGDVLYHTLRLHNVIQTNTTCNYEATASGRAEIEL